MPWPHRNGWTIKFIIGIQRKTLKRMLGGKNILLGITGGIAAYNTPFLVRLLIYAGANVKVVLTHYAGSSVSPLTLATFTKYEVSTNFITAGDGSVNWNNHVELGLWADLMLI